MRRLPAIALVCYVAGYGLGTTLGWLAWTASSHETRYRIGAAL